MNVNLKKAIISFITLLVLTPLFSQSTKLLGDDSLDIIEKEFKELSAKDKKVFSSNYLERAKSQRDSVKIANGYYLFSLVHSHSKKAVVYSDSLINIAESINNKEYLANGYLQKGIQLYYLTKYSEALENYSISNSLYLDLNDDFNLLKVRHYIGLLKNAANQEEEALVTFRSNLLFFEKEIHKTKYQDQYFKSLFALVDAYNRRQKLDSAEIFNQIGIKESLAAGNALYPHFLLSYGATKIRADHSELAMDSLLKGSSLIKNKKKSLCGAYAIISNGYAKIGDTQESLRYLEKIDSIYQEYPQVIFHAKEANQQLYRYHKTNNDPVAQIKAIDKLLVIDSIIKIDYADLDKEILEKYDTPLLLSEKENLISSLEDKNISNRTSIIILSLVSFILVLMLFFFIRRNIIFKRRFDNLMNSLSLPNKEEEAVVEKAAITKKVTTSSSSTGIPEDIVESILLKLADFESSNKFVKKKYSLNSLAKELKTNSSYLSSVINSTKNTNFSNYLNSLKIDYAIQRLKDDKKFRSYTIKAISEEVRFSTAQSFTNAFYKKTKIYPSYFVKKLNESQ